MVGLTIGPYRIIRKIGEGGMGEVYLAEDSRLDRRVAIKAPSSAWLTSADARPRLQREARAAARLNDPRIAAVYDVLEIEGRSYIVIEWVEGETLGAAVARGPFPIERALSLGIEITRALSVAHAAGVIHRDLKPSNVMLTTDGRLKILDFGIAKVADEGGDSITATGEVLGTPGYTAPEQLLGKRADARSDVYGAGAILYELLSGRPPIAEGASGDRLLVALLEPVRDLRVANPAIPREIAAIVMRALEPEPRDRYQSAEEFADALVRAGHLLGELRTTVTLPRPQRRRLKTWRTAAVVVLALAGAAIPAARWWHGRTTTVRSSASPPVVAVLPFSDLSGDPALQYMGAGMADTVGTKLAGVAGLTVVSRLEVHDALQRNKGGAAVYRALGASYVVTGGIQRIADRLQVTVNLLSPDGATIRSGDVYEDSLQNFFALQRRIAEALTERIVGSLSAADRQQLARVQTADLQAMSAYWRGRSLLERPGPEPIDPAIAAFEESIAHDSGFALGYAALGTAYWRKYEQTREPVWATKAREAAEHARQLDPDQAEVRIALATVYSGSGRPDAAIAELGRALELQPKNDAAIRLRADIDAAQGRLQQAIDGYHAALRVRPEYWDTYRRLGILYMRAARDQDALDAFAKVVKLQPDSPIGYQLMGTVHVRTGDLDAAIRDYQAALTHGGSFGTYSALGTVYYMQGRFEDAAQSYARAIALRPKSASTHWNLAEAYRRLGRTGDARNEYTEALHIADDDLRVNPRNAGALAVRGTSLARLGRVAEGLDDAQRAADLAPQDQDVQYHRALALTLAGRTEEAVDAIAQALADGYGRTRLEQDEDLAALRRSPRFRALVSGEQQARRGR